MSNDVPSRARLVAAEPSIAGDLGYTRGRYESPMLDEINRLAAAAREPTPTNIADA